MQKFLRSFLRVKLLVSLLIISMATSAQIVVNVSVLPPTSAVANNYIEQGSNVMITVINNSSLTQQVKLIPSLSGINNGVKIAVNENFIPAAPFVVNAGQTRTATLNQLKINNGNISPNDLQIQGFDINTYLNGGVLPEGLYTFCVKAITINNPSGGSQTAQGCVTVNIISFLPPIITNPVNNSVIKPLNPQFMTFSWTPSGVVGKTRYRFRLVDLTAANVFDPNDAFINENILPYYQQQNIITTSLQLDNSKPKLKEGNRYALQITAYDPLNKLNFKNSGRSKVLVFTYKNEMPIAVLPAPEKEEPKKNEEDAPPGDCSASSKYAGPLKQVNKNGIANGTDILVGKFVMKNTNFSQSNGSYTGVGEILVNFTGAKMKVKFAGIEIGDDNRMFKGTITGMYAANAGITDAMAASKTEIIKALPNAEALMSTLEQVARKINTADVPLPIDLPLSFDKNGFDIGIVGMIFEPTEAYINAVLNTAIPQVFGNEYLLLSAKAVPIHPNGFGAGASLKLALAETQSLAISKNKLYLELIGGADKTFATFDCTGFKNLTLNGAVVLDRNTAIPVDAGFNVINDANVKVKAAFSISALKNFDAFVLNSLSLSHAFALPQANDFIFKADSAAFDLSSLQKISGINTADNNIGNDWIGLYIKTLKLTLPEGFKKQGQGRISLAVNNMFVNKQGMKGTFSAEANPLVTGAIAGWKMTLTKIGLSIDQNTLTGGGIDGTISLPLGDNTTLGFKAMVSKGNQNGAAIALTVITQDEIDANLFLAKIKIEKNSQITLSKDGSAYAASAILNGEIGIDFAKNPGNSNVGKFQLPHLKFQELSIKGKESSSIPDFDMKFVALESQKDLQAKIGGFELNLNELKFKKQENDKSNVGIYLNLGMSLFGGEKDSKNGASANAGFTIWAKHNGTTFKYKNASLDAIAIKADLGVAKLEGSINIYDEDAIYGNGFRGNVSATLAGLGVKVAVGLQFGKTLENKGNYKYWYFDAMADFDKVGINIPGTAASIYGFGGGAYCNMNPSGGSAVIIPGNFKVSNKGGAAPTTSGVTMTPQKGTAGFRAAVLFGITGSREAFNGDVTFSMKLNYENLSVNNVTLDGNAYLMQDPTNLANRSVDKAFLYCHAHIMYDNEANTLSGIFAAKLNVADIVEAGGNISFKFATPKKDKFGDVIDGQKGLKWYIKVGEWTPNTDPFADSARLHAKIGFDATALEVQVRLQGYFMVGNDLLSGLPPLPDAIYAVTKDLGAPIQKSLPASVSNTQGLAFAFGAGIKLSASVGGKLFGISVEAAAGFDVLLSDLNATCSGKPMGIGGWYAQGQAYAYISGNIIAFGGDMASFTAGAVLQVKLPNPTWVKGDIYLHLNVLGIKGDHTRTIERGKLCGNMQTDLNPFEGMKLIKSTTPGNNSIKVNPMGTEMQVKFAYEDLGPIKVINPYTNEYEYYYAQNQVKLLDKNKKEIGDVKITDYYTTTHRIKTTKTLEANSVYYVWAKSEMYGEKTEEVYAKFTTGARPATFGMNDLYESYPLPNQRYFMKHKPDGSPANGNLKFKQDMTYLFEKGGVYVIILDKSGFLVSADQVKGTTNQINGAATSNIIFKIPENLKNNAIYQIKVLAPSKTDGGLGDVIFEGFHFKTSKYNNFNEKFNSLKMAKVGYMPQTSHMEFKAGYGNISNDNSYHTPVIMLTSGEGFDKYEMFGYYKEVGDEKELFGNVLQVFGDANTADLSRKFNYFKTAKLTPIPEFTQSQYTYMTNISNKSNLTWNRPGGYPFYGESTGAALVEPLSSKVGISWMNNIKFYESILKQQGTLKNNEMITGPDGPLTADEINGSSGSGGMVGGFGLGSNAAEKKKYYALIDFTPSLLAYDHTYLTWNWLKAANKISSGDVTVTYALIKKMGFPKIPSGNQTVTFYAKDPTQGGKAAKLELTYMYSPPGK